MAMRLGLRRCSHGSGESRSLCALVLASLTASGRDYAFNAKRSPTRVSETSHRRSIVMMMAMTPSLKASSRFFFIERRVSSQLAAGETLADLDRGAAGGTPHSQSGAALRVVATVGPVGVVTGRTAHWVSPHGAEHHSFTGVRMGAPLAFSSTTTNLAGSVLLALRPTT